MKSLVKLPSLAPVHLATCLDARTHRKPVTPSGQEWHPNAARVGLTRGEAEFLSTPWRDNTGVNREQPKGTRDIVRIWDENHRRVAKLGHAIRKFESDHFRGTGTMIHIIRTTVTPPEKR